jgi:phosphopantothenoylcysteine decarboxylase
MSTDSSNSATLKGREIVFAVCGSIACYKAADAVSKLVQRGAGVTVCMTASAQKFVSPLTFQALSGRKVHSDPWEAVDEGDTQHIGLTERADLLIVAPATANALAKIAAGMADDLVTLLVSAAACPVVFAPAMNHRMWENPITRANVEKLTKLGYRFIGPEEGWLACRNVGAGRMSEPSAIVSAVEAFLSASSAPAPGA